MYLGWNGKLPNDPISLYVLLADAAPVQRDDRADAEFLQELLRRSRRRLGSRAARGLGVLRRHATGRRSSSSTAPRTSPSPASSTSSVPTITSKTMKFTEDRYWIRARLEMGGYVKPPRIARILTNTVEAANVVTVRDEILGSLRRHADPDLRASRTARCSRARSSRSGAGSAAPPEDLDDLGDDPVRAGRRRQGRRLLGALARGRELLRLGAALAPLRAQPDHRPHPVRRRHQGHDAAGGAQQHRRASLPDRRRRARQRQRQDADAADARHRLHRQVLQRHPGRRRRRRRDRRRGQVARAASCSRRATAPSPPRTSRRWRCARRPAWRAPSACPRSSTTARCRW